MYYRLCTRLDRLINYLPDDLNSSTSNDFNKLGDIRNYCSNGGSGETECKTDLDRINAGCLWLFEQAVIINFDNLSNDESKRFIIYIMVWLNNMLNLKKDEQIKNLNDFYTKYIENNKDYNNCQKKIKDNNYNDCSDTLNEKTGYKSFKEFIEKNGYLMNINIMSKFYDAFKSLCKMYTEVDADDPKSKKNLENAEKFVEKYKELNDNSSISGDSSYSQIFSNLSTDYNNFKDYCNVNNVDCNDIPDLSSIKTTKPRVQSSEDHSEQVSDVTPSSSSITNKLIIVLSIFSAIPIFLGISYKYSLFGFRKRGQKQHLREKLKK
ncbi:PIR protein [Plasmodium yoelii]|uniref:PIR protein n=2 Tax=Plasmodium yoelii TaxID=5861 RepID=A0AAF0B664_PLAYO|nr:PIR protein [Plasmodium yoelii]WBY58994.1 PIR protein [Plasmodium yoelii yoelii]CDU19189.1 YIR protein [Plasmodium yoelii]VTZ79824.1 PIR protein [Plasmodium yoelii]|eukprot:XP_022812542.1 PIR protein [Plasmodium yoelii]